MSVAGTRAELLVHLYITYRYYIIYTSPNAESPPSRMLAPTAAPYEISDLREIYGAGRRNFAGSSGGCSSGRGRSLRPSRDVCAELLRLEGFLETQGVPSLEARPSYYGRCLGGGIGSKARAGKTTACCDMFSVR